MKKALILLLAALTALNMFACSEKASDDTVGEVDNIDTEAKDTKEVREGWLELPYGIWIPTPPFDEYDSMMQDNIQNYTLSFEYVDQTALLDYIDSLEGFGFTVKKGNGNAWDAVGPEGQSLHIIFEMSAKKGAIGNFSCYPGK